MLKFLRSLAFIIVGILILATGTIAAAYYLLPSAPTSSTASEEANLDKDNTYNILLCGVDKARENADTMVIASFNAEKKTIKLLSIPRDTISNQERPIKKINASYSVDHIGNIEQTIKEVEMVTAIPIDRYAITTFDGFEQAIDALGGIEMNVPQPLQYSDPYQDLEINIEAGQQVLDGAHALQFVRYRSGYVNGDLGRIQAQQLFFKALCDTLLDKSNLTKVPSLAKVVTEEMETDLTISEMLWFAKEAQGITSDSISMFMLPGSPEYIDELSYYIPSESGIVELINAEFMDANHQITAEDLDLVPYASSVVSTTEQPADDEFPEVDESLNSAYYDTNGSYPSSDTGGTTYDGYNGGAYYPPVEQSTGQSYRGSTTTVTPYEPTVDNGTGGGAELVDNSSDNNYSGNTAPVY